MTCVKITVEIWIKIYGLFGRATGPQNFMGHPDCKFRVQLAHNHFININEMVLQEFLRGMSKRGEESFRRSRRSHRSHRSTARGQSEIARFLLARFLVRFLQFTRFFPRLALFLLLFGCFSLSRAGVILTALGTAEKLEKLSAKVALGGARAVHDGVAEHTAHRGRPIELFSTGHECLGVCQGDIGGLHQIPR